MRSKILAENLRMLCKKHKITLKQMLGDCHLNRNAIYDLEKKETMLSVEKLMVLSKYFNVDTEYLLGYSPFKNKTHEELCNLSTNIKLLCKDKNISIEDFLTSLNLPKNFFYELETGVEPTYDTISAIQEYFDLPVDYLINNPNNNIYELSAQYKNLRGLLNDLGYELTKNKQHFITIDGGHLITEDELKKIYDETLEYLKLQCKLFEKNKSIEFLNKD